MSRPVLHILVPCSLMEAIHILSDDRGEQSHPFQFGQPDMGRVRFGGHDEGEHILEHQPDLIRVGIEGVDVGILFGIIFLPEALSASEVRDSAFHGDASPSESDRLFRLENVLSGSLNQLAVHRFILCEIRSGGGDPVEQVCPDKHGSASGILINLKFPLQNFSIAE